MASFASEISGTQIVEFFSRFGRFGGSKAKLQKLLGDDEFMEWWVKQLEQRPESGLVHGLFTSTGKQIVRVREWNREFGWGIPDEAFAEAEKSVPAWPEEKLVAVVLVPYLADKVNEDGTVMTGVERTFHELWEVAAKQQHANWRWDGNDKAGPVKLRLLKGIEHKPGLRWEVIDLGCNRNKKLIDVRNPEKSPHAGILASAMLHPEWIKAMDGENVPYAWAPGYEVNVSGEKPWTYVPNLRFGGGNRRIQLCCRWCDYYHSGWAVPSFFRE